MKKKVHKVTLLIVDHGDVGAEGIRDVLREARYPNHCIMPQVMATETVEVDWDDGDHPLNYTDRQRAEFQRLFPAVGP